jgi:hypothetical protein
LLELPDEENVRMTKVHEYHQHAEDCIRLAKLARKPEQRELFLQMADTWKTLAERYARSAPRWDDVKGA